MLDKLDPNQTILDLQTLVYPHDPVLLCWEKLVTPDDWCHRQMVQIWLRDTLGLVVPELKKGDQPEELAARGGEEAASGLWAPPAAPVQASLF